MIRFVCSNCSRLISVDEKHSGKKGKCPKCGGVVVVPESSTIIEFACESCGHKLKVPERHGGKKGACPKCKNPVVIPSPKKPPSEGAEAFSIVCSMCEETIQVPETSRGQTVECPACGSYVGDESDASIPSDTDEDSYQEEAEEYEESEGVDRRVIAIVAYTAAGVVVGLIILAAVLRLARPSRQKETYGSESLAQSEIDRAQKFAEQYIGLLQSGEIDNSRQLLGPGLASVAQDSQIERFTEQLTKSEVTRMECRRTHSRQHPEGKQFLLWYALHYNDGPTNVIVSVLQVDQELKIDGIAAQGRAARGRLGSGVSIGTRNYDQLSRVVATAERERYQSIFSKFFCGFAIGILVLCVVYIISWWIVFEKAGYAGWASIVPFYNAWVLAEIAGYSGWLGLLMCFSGFIPYVGGLIGFIVSIIISIGVAKAFNRGTAFGIGLAFLPIIFYPILAFAKD